MGRVRTQVYALLMLTMRRAGSSARSGVLWNGAWALTHLLSCVLLINRRPLLHHPWPGYISPYLIIGS
jgi:hypothetical protein